MTYVLAGISLIVSLYLLGRVFRRHTGVVRWILVEVVYNCFIKYMIGYLGVPSFFNYGSDLILLIIIYLYLYHNQKVREKSGRYRIPASVCLTVSLFFFVCLISWLLNAYSSALFVWGFRNNFRFLIFLTTCAATLRKEDVYEVVDILYVYLLMNVVVVTYQSMTMSSGFGMSYGDYVSGLFSNGAESRGGNASLNWLMCIVTATAVIRYLNKEKRLVYVVVAISSSLYIATLNETKLYFVQLVVIVFLSLILARKSAKTIIITAAVIAGLYFATQFLYELFPNFADFFTLESMIDYASNDSGYVFDNSINRFNGIPYVLDHFLEGPLEILFGIGLGNADYSSTFSLLTSPFYIINGWTAYQWFSVSMLFVETGFAGLICFSLIIFNCARVALIELRRSKSARSLLQLALVIVVLAAMMAICNQSLRLEAMGFTVWMLMSIPFVVRRSEIREEPYRDSLKPSRKRLLMHRGCRWTDYRLR